MCSEGTKEGGEEAAGPPPGPRHLLPQSLLCPGQAPSLSLGFSPPWACVLSLDNSRLASEREGAPRPCAVAFSKEKTPDS